jgi:hypothetical protein
MVLRLFGVELGDRETRIEAPDSSRCRLAASLGCRRSLRYRGTPSVTFSFTGLSARRAVISIVSPELKRRRASGCPHPSEWASAKHPPADASGSPNILLVAVVLTTGAEA